MKLLLMAAVQFLLITIGTSLGQSADPAREAVVEIVLERGNTIPALGLAPADTLAQLAEAVDGRCPG